MVVDESLVCYIQDENTGETVVFNIEKPQGYSDSYTANFQSQDVRGRSSPFQSYVNSGPRTISFSVLLSLDYRRDLAEQTESVRRMMKPYSNTTGVKVNPPRVHVKIGQALDIRAVPSTFSAEWAEGYKEGVFRICTWNFAFTEVEDACTYNNKSSVSMMYNYAYVPLGLDYDMGSAGREVERVNSYDPVVGDTIVLSNKTTGYMTYSEANNNKAYNNSTKTLDEGEYKVLSVKGDAICVASDATEEGVWIETPESQQ